MNRRTRRSARPRAALAAALAVLFASLPLAAGCGGGGGGTSPVRSGGEGVVCTTEVRAGLRVSVADAATGAPVADGARVLVRENDYVESATLAGDTSAYQGADERAGTYVVRVEKAGYQPFEQTGVVVTRDECHVQTVELTARLVPAGDVACTADIRPALQVTVVDDATGAPVAEGATATAREGDYADTLRPGIYNADPGTGQLVLTSLRGADERVGVYTVRVEKPGYRPFEQSGVVVTRDVCHVQTATLTARLVRE